MIRTSYGSLSALTSLRLSLNMLTGDLINLNYDDMDADVILYQYDCVMMI